MDLVKNRINGCRVPMPFDGIRRGGAPIALPPEVVLPKPGPGAFFQTYGTLLTHLYMLIATVLLETRCLPGLLEDR